MALGELVVGGAKDIDAADVAVVHSGEVVAVDVECGGQDGRERVMEAIADVVFVGDGSGGGVGGERGCVADGEGEERWAIGREAGFKVGEVFAHDRDVLTGIFEEDGGGGAGHIDLAVDTGGAEPEAEGAFEAAVGGGEMSSEKEQQGGEKEMFERHRHGIIDCI